MSDDAQGEWIVLLEAADLERRAPIGRDGFDRLMAGWSPPMPTTLFSEDRYAIHVSVAAASAPLALSRALAAWDRAVHRAAVPRWDIVRAEVVSREELERELVAADTDAVCACAGRSDDTSDPEGEELLQRALRDGVTGLSGSALFAEEVRELLAGAAPGAIHALMVVEVAGLGTRHLSDVIEPPDAVLVELAERVRSTVRGGDPVARIGPCQFALFATLSAEGDTGALGRRVVAGVARPLAYRGASVVPTVSLGVATARAGSDPDRLVLSARAAMRAVGAGGGSRLFPNGSPSGRAMSVRHQGGRCGTNGRT